MFLAKDQLEELTGCKRKSSMIEWLKSKRYPFEIGADGMPKVLHSFVIAKLGGIPQKHEPRLRLENSHQG